MAPGNRRVPHALWHGRLSRTSRETEDGQLRHHGRSDRGGPHCVAALHGRLLDGVFAMMSTDEFRPEEWIDWDTREQGKKHARLRSLDPILHYGDRPRTEGEVIANKLIEKLEKELLK